MERPYQICTKTIMDTTDPDITFDEKGISNHYYKYIETKKKVGFGSNELQKKAYTALIKKIKVDGKGKKYDCIIGVSGGVDSTYVAYIVKKEFGLRPLAVHFDNGWNSELAVKNIENTLKILGIDLYTYVVDWEEFKDIQLSFLKASTPDGEVPTDHAIMSLLYKIASKYGLKYILNGVNVESESIMPLKWGYGYHDFTYIKSIQKKFGTQKIKAFPHFSLAKLAYYTLIKGIQFIPILNYVEYKKEAAMSLIQDYLGWKYYGGKHYESIYTRFFQAYILPKKFNIDKRRAHLSNLICSNQISREAALEIIKTATCPQDLMQQDKEYTIKKFGITENEFDQIMALPTKVFLDYETQYHKIEKIKQFRKK